MTCPYCGSRYMGMICPNCNHRTNTAPPPPPSMYTRRRAVRPLLIALIVFIFLAAAFIIFRIVMTSIGMSRTRENMQSQTAGTQQTTSPAKAKTASYAAGDYEVGKTIPAGTYLLCDSLSGHIPFHICSKPYNEATHQSEDDLFFGWCTDNQLITLEEGQYIHFSHCKLVGIENSPERDPYQTPGMYIVGKDLPAGESCIVSCGEDAGYDIADKPLCPTQKIEKSGILHTGEKVLVTLKDGQVLDLLNCKLTNDHSAVTAAATTASPFYKPDSASLEEYVKAGHYPEGTYEAGTDIPAGIYLLLPVVDLEILDKKERDLEPYRAFYLTVTQNGRKIIDDWKNNSYYVKLEPGMTIEFAHAYMIDDLKTDSPLNVCSNSGMFIVGRTTTSKGKYKVVRTGDGSSSCIRVYSGLPLDDTEPLEVINITKDNQTIELKENTTIVMDYCHLVKN